MTKLLYVNPMVRDNYWMPNSDKGFSLVFDTEFSRWQEKLNEALDQSLLSNCRLLCLYGAYAKKAEDIADDWLIQPTNHGLFFPTVADDNVNEIMYTVQTSVLVLLTDNPNLVQAFSEVEL